MLTVGGVDATEVHVGSAKADAVYLGAVKVWPAGVVLPAGPSADVVGHPITGLHGPYGLAAVGSKLYVTNMKGNSVAVVDAATGALTATAIPLPGAMPNFIFRLSTEVYVAAVTGGDGLIVIDPATDTVIKTFPQTDISSAQWMLELGGKGYIANGSHNNVAVVDLATRTITKTIPLTSGGTSLNPVGLAVVGGNLYVSVFNPSGKSGVVVVDLATDTTTFITAPFPNTYVAAPIAAVGKLLYMVDANGSAGAVHVFDTTTNTITKVIHLGANRPTSIAVSATKAYVIEQLGNVVVIDLATNTVTKTLTGFNNPKSLEIVGSKMYVTCYGDDTIAVIS